MAQGKHSAKGRFGILRRILVGIFGVLVVLGIASAAYAYFSSTGIGSGHAAVASANLDHITISPTSTTVVAGQSQSYAVTAVDNFGGTTNVTSSATLSITNGTCTSGANPSCTSTVVGAQTVTATYLTKTAPATQTVNKAATSTAVTGNGTSVSGQSVTFTATVATTAPGSANATGNVAFNETPNAGSSTPISGCTSQPLSGTSTDTATCTTNTLVASGSAYTITATYAGTANYSTSISPGVTQTVNKAATTTAVAGNGTSVVGQQVTYTATVSVTSPGSGTPSSSDSVTFKDGASTISCATGSSTFNGTTATCLVTYTTTTGSPHTITAVFGGDANFATSTSTGVTQIVNAAATSTAVVSSADPSVVGQQVTYTATVSVTSPGSGTPSSSDSVTFKDGASTISCATGSSTFNGTTATCLVTYTTTTGSPHTITAVFGGDANYTTSTGAATSGQLVNAAATATAVNSNHNPSVVGQQVTYTATVSVTSPGSGTPSSSDSVTFKDGASTISCATGSSTFNGTTATCLVTYTTTTGSPHTITAVFGGDANFATSTSTGVTQIVNAAATSTAVVSSADPSVVGQQVTYTATVSVTSPGSGTPSSSDSVTFKDGASTISCATGSSTFNGTTATCLVTYTTTTGSPHTITAVFGGDANYTTSTSTGVTQTINKASPTLTAGAPSTGTAGTAITPSSISAVLAGSSGSNDVNTITFAYFEQTNAPTTCTTGGTTVGTTTPAGNGTYSPSTGFTPSTAGNYWWYVTAPSDANNNAAASTCGPTMTETVVGGGAPKATSVASTSATGSSATVSSFSTTSGATYVVTVAESASHGLSTPGLTISGSPSVTAIDGNDYSTNCTNQNDCAVWAWWFNANQPSTSISVSLGSHDTQTVVDVLALSGNSTSSPIVTAATNDASGCNEIIGCTPKTTTVSANLATTATSGDSSVEIVASDDTIGGTALTWSPAGPTEAFQSSNTNGSLGVYVTSLATENESTSASGFGGNNDWGTIAFEINS